MEMTFDYEDISFTVRYDYMPPEQETLYSPPEEAELEIIEIGLCGKNHRFIALPDEAQQEILRRIEWMIEEACWEDLRQEMNEDPRHAYGAKRRAA